MKTFAVPPAVSDRSGAICTFNEAAMCYRYGQKEQDEVCCRAPAGSSPGAHIKPVDRSDDKGFVRQKDTG